MKQIHGIYLPDSDKHFDTMISVGRDEVHGRGTYQLKKYKAAMKYVRSRGLAVDIGAHVGLWSRVMSHDFERVMAFEPLKAHRECFPLNMDKDNVVLMPFAISNEPGSLSIHMPADNTGHAHVGKGEMVQAITLDSLSLDQRIDFLKIDVEGWEYNALLGAKETITQDKPVIIIEQKPKNAENYGRKRHDARDLLIRWGMKEAEEISGDHVLVW